MCRLLGIVASEPTEFRIVLREAPRSMAALSVEHRDGWGLAIHRSQEDPNDSPWTLHKGLECATEDAAFHKLAVGSRGELLIAHIRKRTVGPTLLENTHPFQRGEWVFAHNGTVSDLDFLRQNSSKVRLSEVQGSTDSELLFAFIMTRLDDTPEAQMNDVLSDTMREVTARREFGACNFLLSNGRTIFAHRSGRTLYMLARGPQDRDVKPRASVETGAKVETPWSSRRHALFIASERLTDEPWEEVSNGVLLRIDRLPYPSWQVVHGDTPFMRRQGSTAPPPAVY